ncbi:MAG: hypothetical protein HUJ56_13065, partial [Erysipelotrichaceae bacterium]|nr:hypothetical protein [Erysipelotrichaceae bacterium]
VTPLDVLANIEGEKIYGQATSTAASDYNTTSGSTLALGESIDWDADGTTVVIKGTLDNKSNAGVYTYTHDATAGQYTPYVGTAGATQNYISGLDNIQGSGEYSTFHAENYNIKYDSEYTIKQRHATVNTESTRTFGAKDNTFEYTSNPATDTTGFVNGDVATLKDVLTTTDKSNTWLDVNRTGYKDGDNYAIAGTKIENLETDFINGALTETLRNNYIIDAGDEVLKINPAKLTVVIDGEKYYGESTATSGSSAQYKDASGSTITITGFKNSDATGFNKDLLTLNVDNLVDDEGDGGSDAEKSKKLDANTTGYKGSRDTSGKVEDQAIYISSFGANDKTSAAETDNVFKSSNYEIETSSTYKVNKAVVDAKVIGSKTYGDATSQNFIEGADQYSEITVTAQTGKGAVVDNDLKNYLDLTNSTDATTGAGVYSNITGTNPVISQVGTGIKATYDNAKNYELRNLNSTYTINKRNAVITSEATNTYGEELAAGAVTYKYDNFVNDDQNSIGKTVLDGYMKYDDTDPKGLGSVA